MKNNYSLAERNRIVEEYLPYVDQVIRRNKALIRAARLEYDDVYGKKVPLELQVRSYYSGGNLALLLVDWSDDYPEPWGDLSVNLGYAMEKDCAFVDVNDMGEEILPWIEKNGLGTPTGRTQQSGFVTYPEYRFHADRLRALDDYGYQEYSERYDREHGRME